jgi:prepilin peptidase CpaA
MNAALHWTDHMLVWWAHQAVLWACLGFLLRIAWHDFQTFRIRNNDVLILCAMVLGVMVLRGFAGAVADLMAGLLLFGLGFVLWMLRLMGAGDVKLYLPLGVLVGWALLPIYVVFLLVGSLGLMIAVLMARRFPSRRGVIRARLSEIASTKSVPYAVPMVFAAIMTLLPQALALSG